MRKSLLAHCLIIINIVYIVAAITFSLMCIIVLPSTVQNDLLSLGLQVYDFAVTWLPRSLTPRCPAPCRVTLHDVLHTLQTLTLRCHVPYRVMHTPGCPTNRRLWLRGVKAYWSVLPTTENNFALASLPWSTPSRYPAYRKVRLCSIQRSA